MSEKEISEGNQKIAEFMGLKYFTSPNYGHVWIDSGSYNDPRSIPAKYHKSWDWLMSAIDKIRSMEDEICEAWNSRSERKYIKPYVEFSLIRKIARFIIGEEGNPAMPVTSISYGYNALEASFRQVVSFIEWYESRDLFQCYKSLPEEISEIIKDFEEGNYNDCKKLLERLKPLGYTFDYGLDAVPFNLRKIK